MTLNFRWPITILNFVEFLFLGATKRIEFALFPKKDLINPRYYDSRLVIYNMNSLPGRRCTMSVCICAKRGGKEKGQAFALVI